MWEDEEAMSVFHVYVEGAVDRTADGVERLADAIAQKFGIPVTDLTTRLATARFRVKANVDRATADAYAKTLVELGAKVRVEEASKAAGPSTSGLAAAGAPAAGSGNAARPSTPSLPPGNAARPSTPSLPLPTTPATPAAPGGPGAAFISGLSAAFTPESASTDLGALSGSMALASLDGDDDKSPAAAGVEPPSAGLPASFGPPPPAPTAAKVAKPAALDLFAPPDEAEGDPAVMLASDEIAHQEAKRAAVAERTPPQGVPVTPAPLQAPVRNSAPVSTGGVSAAAGEVPRARFAAGVLLAIVIGFVPAHLIAGARERSAFAAIDVQVVKQQQDALETPELYDQLDAFRNAQLIRKQGEQRSIALTSMLLWAAISAGLAFVWFRKVPWDRLGGRF